MLKIFDFGGICYEIKNGRHILVWLARWGGSLPGQLRYADTEARGEIQIFPDFLRISAETRRMVTIARL